MPSHPLKTPVPQAVNSEPGNGFEVNLIREVPEFMSGVGIFRGTIFLPSFRGPLIIFCWPVRGDLFILMLCQWKTHISMGEPLVLNPLGRRAKLINFGYMRFLRGHLFTDS